MANNADAISVTRVLYEHELFYFTSQTLAHLLAFSPSRVYSLVRQLVRAGFVAEIENGKYLLLGFEPERVLANPLFIACHLVTPAYVSFWSALHAHGFTEQAPHTVFVATTKKKRPVEFAGHRFRFVTIQPRKLFGYRREQVDGLPVVIADEPKALTDSLSELKYAGGIAEVAKALRAAIDTLDVEVLVAYANRMADRTLGSRLGYLLDLLNHAVEPCDDANAIQAGLGPRRLIRSGSLVKLDPGRPAGDNHDARWRLDINVSDAELIAEGIG